MYSVHFERHFEILLLSTLLYTFINDCPRQRSNGGMSSPIKKKKQKVPINCNIYYIYMYLHITLE